MCNKKTIAKTQLRGSWKPRYVALAVETGFKLFSYLKVHHLPCLACIISASEDEADICRSYTFDDRHIWRVKTNLSFWWHCEIFTRVSFVWAKHFIQKTCHFMSWNKCGSDLNLQVVKFLHPQSFKCFILNDSAWSSYAASVISLEYPALLRITLIGTLDAF